jgi:hypothetical protein
MVRLLIFLSVSVSLVLASCSPSQLEISPTSPPTPAISTVYASTTLVGTAEPVVVTPFPENYTPPPAPPSPTLTPIPPIPGGLGPTELKYRLLTQFPDLFFCDPDFYPVARADEADLARQRFPELQANPEEFNAILAHNGISASASYNDEQKLLIYREHKKLAAIQFTLAPTGYQFQLRIAINKGSGEQITGLIDGQGTTTVQQRSPTLATCPICLAAGTMIATPDGPIPVQNLRAGMPVWTMDRSGVRIARPVVRIGKTVVPSTHQVVHLELQDGRQLWVSPGHPTADGRTVGQLQAGDGLDGGIVRSVDLVRYTGYAIYDLLPAGDTGFYWANGILLGSTLL